MHMERQLQQQQEREELEQESAETRANRTALLREEILLELESWRVGGEKSKMKEMLGELTEEGREEVEEEIRRLSSAWRTEDTYPGDVSLAAMVALKGVPAQILACDLESGEARAQAEIGGLTEEVNRKCTAQGGVQLLWWKEVGEVFTSTG